jgi:tetratricopeptide (TPR) repeat protein
VALAADLEKHTPVVFVGEPTGGHPNRYTDTGLMVLPNSKLHISYSPFFWPYTFPGDRRSWIAPHVAIDVTSGDYAAGRDPAMDAILRYRPQPPLADQLMTVATASGLDAALTRLSEWQADGTHRYLDTEWEMHLFGRRLMVSGMLREAIRVFEVNAGAHPTSYRAFEDLGTALEKAGDLQAAATHYRKSLELNPANLEPAEGLERIAKSGGLPK